MMMNLEVGRWGLAGALRTSLVGLPRFPMIHLSLSLHTTTNSQNFYFMLQVVSRKTCRRQMHFSKSQWRTSLKNSCSDSKLILGMEWEWSVTAFWILLIPNLKFIHQWEHGSGGSESRKKLIVVGCIGTIWNEFRVSICKLQERIWLVGF